MPLDSDKLAIFGALQKKERDIGLKFLDVLKRSLAAYEKALNKKVDKAMERVDAKLRGVKNGYTPRKGIDYFDGEHGKTPRKGIDYFDGDDGYTPVKNVDYFDGAPGDSGRAPEHQWSDTQLRFKNPDGSWGEWKELKGAAGAGVTNMRIAQAFKYIFKTEEPVGAINGSNRTYSLSQPIFAIVSMSLNGEVIAQLPNYVISGRSFTLASPLPAAYAGKDFEVKYI